MRLIDADALIDDIRGNLWDWDTVDGITATTVLKQTIRDIQNQPTIGSWISVKDRLPKIRHAVLAYTPHYNNIWALSLHEDGKWYIWQPGYKVYEPEWSGAITHWMPLPEPPKEET